MSLLSLLFGRNKQSAQVAKQRLQAVLEQERTARGQPRRPDYLPALQREL
ncbi:MAG TPA: cell division topological specificity factor MinE, partial [Burkholderiaceae bacterium]